MFHNYNIDHLNNLNKLGCGFFICDIGGEILDCNAPFFQKLGYLSKQELQLKSKDQIYSSSVEDIHSQYLNNDYTNAYVLDLFHKKGNVVSFEIHSFKILNNNDREIIINYCEDRSMLQDQLVKLNQFKIYETYISSNDDGVLFFEFDESDNEYYLVYSNFFANSILIESISNKKLNQIFHFIDTEKINDFKKNGYLVYDWLSSIANTNLLFYLSINFKLIINTNDKKIVLVKIKDITEHKIMLNKLENQLRDNILLLSEKNNRFNSNLNIIDSILEINKIGLNDTHILDKLSNIQLKLKCISLSYLKIEKGTNYVNVKKYISEISNCFLKIINSDGFRKIEINSSICDEIFLTSFKTVQLGIIISELLINSYKFVKESSDMSIDINITNEGKGFKMKYTDSGKGLPINVMDLKSGKFGFKLIEIMISQLDGIYELPISKNFEFKLEFSN